MSTTRALRALKEGISLLDFRNDRLSMSLELFPRSTQPTDAQGRALGALLREAERQGLPREIESRLAASRAAALAHARVRWAQAEADPGEVLATRHPGFAAWRKWAMALAAAGLAGLALHQIQVNSDETAWEQELHYHVTAEEAQD